LGSNVKPELPIVGSKIKTVASIYGNTTASIKLKERVSSKSQTEPKKLILRLNLNKH
jgi:hypothetical protein